MRYEIPILAFLAFSVTAAPLPKGTAGLATINAREPQVCGTTTVTVGVAVGANDRTGCPGYSGSSSSAPSGHISGSSSGSSPGNGNSGSSANTGSSSSPPHNSFGYVPPGVSGSAHGPPLNSASTGQANTGSAKPGTPGPIVAGNGPTFIGSYNPPPGAAGVPMSGGNYGGGYADGSY